MAHTPDTMIVTPQGPESMMLPTLEMVVSAVSPEPLLCVYSIASTKCTESQMDPFVEPLLCARDLAKHFIGIILFYSSDSQIRNILLYPFYM